MITWILFVIKDPLDSPFTQRIYGRKDRTSARTTLISRQELAY